MSKILGGRNCKGCIHPTQEQLQARVDDVLRKAFDAVRPIVERELEAENVSDIMELSFK